MQQFRLYKEHMYQNTLRPLQTSQAGDHIAEGKLYFRVLDTHKTLRIGMSNDSGD